MGPEGTAGDIDYDADYRPVFHDFYELIKHRVGRILLVSSLYDAFTLEEEGLLFEQISGEYRDLLLPFPPQVIRVSSASDGLEELRNERYDLIITMARISDMECQDFAARAKEIQDIPVVLLLTEMADIQYYHRPGAVMSIDKVFYWNGDSALYLAITKYIEDTMNIAHDTSTGLVRAILVIEDSPRYYSIFLPLIYTEIMQQTRALITEGLNEHEERLRIRSRPKIILAETYEEAMEMYKRYRHQIMGVISDVKYKRNGIMDGEAGFRFAEEIDDEIPILLQSSNVDCASMAADRGITFIDKNSESILQELRDFFTDSLGFGEFVFTRPDGTELARASDLREFIEIVESIPIDSLKFHGSAHHFSNWLKARGEIDLARRLRDVKVTDFELGEEIREFLLDSINESRRVKQLGVITDFNKQNFEFDQTFTRLGGGSLGGKGRGIAFLSMLLNQSMITSQFEGIEVKIPETIVIATDEFDRFILDNELHDFIKENRTDEELSERFLSSRISDDLRESLGRFLDHARWPIAVRSSSLLEDSQNQPFAGLYSTYILPNNCDDDGTRLEQLEQAIKLVYASAFYKRVKAYIRATGLIPEEEKMAVVIQRLIGNRHGDRFYPSYSGVAQSHNFYPVHPLRREEGVASLALGLGKIVVDGEKVLSVSPDHPNVIPGFYTPDDVFKNSQNHFYALNMSESCFDLGMGEDITLSKLPIPTAQEDGTLDDIASTFDANDGRLRDGVGTDGPKLITFAGILKYGKLPLIKVIKELLDIGQKGMGRAVEIELAGRHNDAGDPEFYVVQVRPLVTMRERSHLQIGEAEESDALVLSDRAMGNGIVSGITDVVYVRPETFDTTETMEIAREIGTVNEQLDGTPYLLIGPGRWGTRDRFLGVPVEWDQISWAKSIVEVQLEGFRIDPSHGTHFFHNITALGIPYFTIGFNKEGENVDWEWFDAQKAVGSYKHIRHIRSEVPLTVKVDGRSGRGIVTTEPTD